MSLAGRYQVWRFRLRSWRYGYKLRECPRCGSKDIYWIDSPKGNGERYAMCSDCTWGED